MPVIVGFDATPLLGTRTGIGRYVEGLAAALAGRPGLTMRPTAFSLRGLGQLPGVVPEGMRAVARPAPANLLQRLWMRGDFPPVEAICGRVDVFHGTNFVLPPVRRAAGVLTVHDLAFLRLPETVQAPSDRFRTLVPRGLTRAAVVLTPTAAVADELAEAYAYPRERCVVTSEGVDPAWGRATPVPEKWLTDRGLTSEFVVAVGSQEPRKGLATLVAALRDPALAGVQLALIGPPGWGPELSRAGLDPARVVQLGYLPDEELRGVVAAAACLVYPSVYEGFGFPPLEAMACGVPVVVSDLAALRETCGEHARFAPAGSAEAFAAAVAATLAGGGPTPEAARRAHAAGFTWDRCAEATTAAYRRAEA